MLFSHCYSGWETQAERFIDFVVVFCFLAGFFSDALMIMNDERKVAVAEKGVVYLMGIGGSFDNDLMNARGRTRTDKNMELEKYN
jgi:hypothetical protein